jgi:PBP4 family serine-type D-alanyl-D-alanine carboxypeptidase
LLFSHNADDSFVPASNQKLLLSAAALAQLGPDYRFRTLLFADAAPEGSSVIHGNIYLKGYGDPTLDRSDLAAFVMALKKDGLRSIAGDLVADDSYFSGSPFGSGWLPEDLDKTYAAPACALSLEGNLLTVSVSPGPRRGAKAQVSVDPSSPLVSIANNCLTVKKDDRSWTSLSRLEGNSFRLSGRIAAGHDPIVRVITIRDPSLFVASVFAEMLKTAGIVLNGQTRLGTVPNNALPLATDFSPSLPEILSTMNKGSNNFFAEQILRTLGAELNAVGDDLAGTQAVVTFLDSMLPGRPHPVLCDGCGLSTRNSLRPSLIAALLARLPSAAYWKEFVNSLPVAGVDGTLKRRLKGTPAQGKIHAKTGTLEGVSALSGYVMNGDRPLLAFSLLTNGFSSPRSSIQHAENEICLALCRYAKHRR